MKKSDHEKRATAFRKQLAEEAVKPRDQQQWPTIDEWPTIRATATCRTPNCPAENTPFPVQLHENADGIYRATCGPCGQPHTDLTTTFDDTGPTNLATPRPGQQNKPEPGTRRTTGPTLRDTPPATDNVVRERP
jgi:hypothetical protein